MLQCITWSVSLNEERLACYSQCLWKARCCLVSAYSLSGVITSYCNCRTRDGPADLSSDTVNKISGFCRSFCSATALPATKHWALLVCDYSSAHLLIISLFARLFEWDVSVCLLSTLQCGAYITHSSLFPPHAALIWSGVCWSLDERRIAG